MMEENLLNSNIGDLKSSCDALLVSLESADNERISENISNFINNLVWTERCFALRDARNLLRKQLQLLSEQASAEGNDLETILRITEMMVRVKEHMNLL